MTTQAAAQAAPAASAAAANGATAQGAPAGPAIKKEVSPVPDGMGAHAPAGAAAAGPGSRGDTPATDGRQASASASPAPAAAAGSAAPEAAAAAAEAPPSKEDEEQRRLEDEILAEGQAIAGVRALLAKAFRYGSPPVPVSGVAPLLPAACTNPCCVRE